MENSVKLWSHGKIVNIEFSAVCVDVMLHAEQFRSEFNMEMIIGIV